MKKSPYLSKVCNISTYHANFDKQSDFLDTIARQHSIKKWPSSKERVGSREDVTSSNQDIKTNGATLVCRRGVRGSCFVLHCVFVYA